MSSALHDYLHSACTPERAVTIEDASDTLSKVGMTAHEDSISQILAMAEEGRTDDTLGAMLSILHATYADVINNYGIRFSDEMSLREKTELVNGLESLADYLDMDIIADVLSQGTTPEDTLADLLELVTSADAEHWFTLLVDVTPSLIERLQTIVSDRLRVLSDLSLVDHVQVTALKTRLRQRLGEYLPPLVLTTIDNRQWRVGYNLQDLTPAVLHALSELTDDEAAKAAVAFAALSNVEDAGVRAGVSHILDAAYTDINQITRINGIVNRIWSAQ